MIKRYGKTFGAYVYLAAACSSFIVLTFLLALRPSPNLELVKTMVEACKWALMILLGGGVVVGVRSAAEDFSPRAWSGSGTGGQGGQGGQGGGA